MLILLPGAWTSPSTFQISIEGNVNAAPPEIGHLIVTTKESGNIRNSPPQSAPSIGVESPPLDGNFGPSAIQILAFTAHDPENTARVVSDMCVLGGGAAAVCSCVYIFCGDLIAISPGCRFFFFSNFFFNSITRV